jgi:nucleoside-specific outer membrane channel protein Tsx
VVGAVDAGAVYVFHYDGTAWVEEAKLEASDAAANDAFGLSVAVAGDTAVVGAALDDDGGSDSGSAYVFHYDGTVWVEEAKLTPSDGAAFDQFGSSVAAAGDTIVVGARLDDDNGSDSGSAYVFRYDGTVWVEEAKLKASDGAPSDTFGNAVAVAGETAAVGAQFDDDNGADSGSAYVFRYDGATWVEQAKLVASDGAPSDTFGNTVAVAGETVVVGAQFDDDNGTDAGLAYVFRYDGTAWVEQAKLTPSDGTADDMFGGSVAVSGDTAVVGAALDDDNGSSSGSAYVFPIPEPSAWMLHGSALAVLAALALRARRRR